MPSEADVLAALARVADPCSIATGAPVDLVEMGLVERVELSEGQVTVTLRLTSPICWQSSHIVAAARRHVLELEGVTGVTVEIDHEGDWMPELMAPEARERLRRLRPLELVGQDRAANA
jgi:metal-sulfur cluster biosynthetic enzyme